MTFTIPYWWFIALLCLAAYLAGIVTPFAYLAVEDWLFRRRMRKAGLRI